MAEKARVATLLLEESFGELVKAVGSHLIHQDGLMLSEIIKGTDLTAGEVKKCLCVLIQHQLVSTHTSKSGSTVYKIMLEQVLLRLLHPYSISAVRDLGSMAEYMVEYFIQYGQSTMSKCIYEVCKRVYDESRLTDKDIIRQAKEEFDALVSKRLLQRVPVSGSEQIPPSERYALPPVTISDLVNRKRVREENDEPISAPQSKRHRPDNTQAKSDDNRPDDDILWHINGSQFKKLHRHKAMLSAAAQRISDPTCTLILKTLLSIDLDTLVDIDEFACIGHQIFLSKIRCELPPTVTLTDLKQHLSLLVDENFVVCKEEAGGGAYCVNYQAVAKMMCRATLDTIVRERFGAKPHRLFRLLTETHLEQKQIANKALLPNKEAKEMLYSLLAENFVCLQSHVLQTTPPPEHSIFSRSTCLKFQELCCKDVTKLASESLSLASLLFRKAMGNLISRRKHEAADNSRLLDKYSEWAEQQRTDMGEELDEVLTPAERELAENVKRSIARLHQGELQLVSTILCIEDYLKFLTTSWRSK